MYTIDQRSLELPTTAEARKLEHTSSYMLRLFGAWRTWRAAELGAILAREAGDPGLVPTAFAWA